MLHAGDARVLAGRAFPRGAELSLDSDLAAVVLSWPDLPEHVRLIALGPEAAAYRALRHASDDYALGLLRGLLAGSR